MSNKELRSTDADETLLTGYSGRMFIILTAGLGTVKIGQDVIPPLLPAIIDGLAITTVEAGVALSIMSVCFSLVQYPSGRVADQLSSTTVLVASIGTVIVGLIALTGAVSYALFLLGVITLGIGRGLYPTADRTLLSKLFVERRGEAFGINLAAGDIGGTVAAGLAAVVLAVATWRVAFIPIVLVLLPVLLFLLRWSRESIVIRRVGLGLRDTGSRVFGRFQIRWILIAYTLYVFTLRGFLGFLPSFLQADHGFSTSLASIAYALLFASGLVYKPLCGYISDYMNRALLGAMVLIMGSIGVGILVLSVRVWVIFGGLLIYAIGHKGFGTVMQAYLMDTFPDRSMGGDLGAVRTVYMTLGSIGPAYVGFVASRLNYTVAFAGFGVCYLVAGGVILRVALVDR